MSGVSGKHGLRPIKRECSVSLKVEAKKKKGLWRIYADIKMMERVLQDTKWKAGKDAQSVSVAWKAAKEALIY